MGRSTLHGARPLHRTPRPPASQPCRAQRLSSSWRPRAQRRFRRDFGSQRESGSGAPSRSVRSAPGGVRRLPHIHRQPIVCRSSAPDRRDAYADNGDSRRPRLEGGGELRAEAPRRCRRSRAARRHQPHARGLIREVADALLTDGTGTGTGYVHIAAICPANCFARSARRTMTSWPCASLVVVPPRCSFSSRRPAWRSRHPPRAWRCAPRT